MLHDPKFEKYPSHIEDVNDWWRGPGTCISGSWRKFEKAVQHDAEKKKAEESAVVAAVQPNPAPPVPEAAKQPEQPEPPKQPEQPQPQQLP